MKALRELFPAGRATLLYSLVIVVAALLAWAVDR